MSITSGFFNAKDGDRVYDAFQMSSIFDGIIRDGIFGSYGDKLIVKADISDGDRVIVGTGRAWFDHTWTLNDAPIVLTMPAPEAVLKRIDTIVLDVNRNVNTRKNSILIVKGTPATNPVPTPRIKSEEHNQFMLAQILRTPGKKITAADITSSVGTNETPYVTAPIQSISIESLLNQLNTQWSEWWVPFKSSTESQQRAFLQQMQAVITELEEQAQQLMDDQLAIFTAWRTQIEKDYNTWLTNFKTGANKDKLDFNTWIDLQKTEYAAWLAIFKKDADDDKAEFDAWVETQKTEFNTWVSTFKTAAEKDATDFETWMAGRKVTWDNWMSDQQVAFNAWWDVLKDQLEDIDVAGLLNRLGIVETDIVLKADKSYVDTELGKKVSTTKFNTDMGLKSDKTYVDTELGKKADTSYVDTELGKRVLTTKFNTDMGLKADKTYLDTELGKRVLTTKFNTDMGLKADKTYVDTKIGDIDLALQGVLAGE